MDNRSYKFRMLDELDELDGRIRRLDEFLTERKVKLVIDAEEKIKLLEDQLKVMKEYRSILLKRINIEYS